MIKESIRQKDMTIINIYAPNIRIPKYIQQILTDLKGETDNNTITVGDFNTQFQQWINHTVIEKTWTSTIL